MAGDGSLQAFGGGYERVEEFKRSIAAKKAGAFRPANVMSFSLSLDGLTGRINLR